jgi:hypothetical protein
MSESLTYGSVGGAGWATAGSTRNRIAARLWFEMTLKGPVGAAARDGGR